MKPRDMWSAVAQPRCMSEPRSLKRMLSIAAVLFVCIFVTVWIWPSPFVILVFGLSGIVIVTHPVCYLTGFNHRHK